MWLSEVKLSTLVSMEFLHYIVYSLYIVDLWSYAPSWTKEEHYFGVSQNVTSFSQNTQFGWDATKNRENKPHHVIPSLKGLC